MVSTQTKRGRPAGYYGFPYRKSRELSTQQKEILRLLSEGYAKWEIATRINKSNTTLRYHLFAIRRKLDALNTIHAVAVAIRRGLI